MAARHSFFEFRPPALPRLDLWIDPAKRRLSPDNSRVPVLGSVTSELP
jgi:hypothetical protein